MSNVRQKMMIQLQKWKKLNQIKFLSICFAQMQILTFQISDPLCGLISQLTFKRRKKVILQKCILIGN